MKGPFPSRAEEGESILLVDQQLLVSDPGHGQHWLKNHSDGATGGSGAEDTQGGRKAVEQRKCALRGHGKGEGDVVGWEVQRLHLPPSETPRAAVPMPGDAQRHPASAPGLWERGRGQDPLLFVAAV